MNVDFPTPGGPLMPDPGRSPGVLQQLHQQLLGRRPVVRALRLDQGDRPGQHRAGAVEHALGQRGDVDRAGHQSSSRAAVSFSSRSTAASAITVPGPNTAAAPASCSAG